MSESITVVKLGDLRISNPRSGDPSFLSAASGAVWTQRSGQFYAVGDDQGSVGEYKLKWADVQRALRTGGQLNVLQPGDAQRIIPTALSHNEDERKEQKEDFEALTIIRRHHIEQLQDPIRKTALRRFSHGLLLIAGSGGISWGGKRRSACIVYSLNDKGHLSGVPSTLSLEGLHDYLRGTIPGDLNIEGICVHGQQVILAQRGNSLDEFNRPAPNLLIRLSLAEVLRSLCEDLLVNQCELEEVREYDLGHVEFNANDQSYQVKLDFTDIDSVEDDPENRLVFTAAAEATEPEIEGQIAGSVIGIIGADGEIHVVYPLEDRSIKLEGVNGAYNEATGSIDLLLVSDADDPTVPAPLMAARIRV